MAFYPRVERGRVHVCTGLISDDTKIYFHLVSFRGARYKFDLSDELITERGGRMSR